MKENLIHDSNNPNKSDDFILSYSQLVLVFPPRDGKIFLLIYRPIIYKVDKTVHVNRVKGHFGR